MRPNRLKELWQRGGAALNGWLSIPSAFSAELMAHQGFDSLTIDVQHGLMGYETALTMLQAISTTDVTPLARAPWNEPGIIMKLLDAGAYGIICPMVNSRAEAEAFVGACRYPPGGYRSFGPTRARLYGGDDYPEQANSHVLTFAMIETAAALERADEIMSTPGLDAIYVGPADLSQSLGGPERFDYTDARLVAALDAILAAARRHNVAAGLHCASASYARHAIARGFRFVTVQSDAAYLEQWAGHVVAEVREVQAEGFAETGRVY